MLFKIITALFLWSLHTAEAASLFISPDQDESLKWLGFIFGGMGGMLPDENNPILGGLFHIFNVGLATIGVIVLSYTTFIASMQTAHEGQLMGRQLSHLWIPIRTMLGYGLLTPTLSGYSLIQIAFMWCIIQGVGLGNHIWSTALDFYMAGYSSNSQGTTTGQLAHLDPQTKTFVENFAQSIICAYTLNELTSESDKVRLLRFQQPTDRVMAYVENSVEIAQDRATSVLNIKIGLPLGRPEQAGLCGTIGYQVNTLNDVRLSQIPSGDTHDRLEKEVRTFALARSESVQSELITLFERFYRVYGQQMATRRYQTPASEMGNAMSADFQRAIQPLSNLTEQYFMNRISQSRTDLINQGDNRARLAETMRQKGWIIAGTFYYEMTRAGHALTTYLDKMPDLNNDLGNIDSRLRNPIHTAKQYFSEQFMMQNTDHDARSGSVAYNGLTDMIFNATFGAIGRAIVSSIHEDLIGSSDGHEHLDPIVQMTQFGQYLMQICEFIFIGMTILALIQVIVGSFSYANPMAHTLDTLITFLALPLNFFMMIFWGNGAVLGVYLPFIPFIFYFSGLTTWFILCIEALIAAPIVALAYTAPSQDEFGQALPTLHLLANIVLRPALLLLGFIASTRLVIVVFNLLSQTLMEASFSIASPGFFAALGMLTTLSLLYVHVAQECFSLIYIIPDRVIRWIGGHAERSNADTMIQKARQAADQGAKHSQAALMGGMKLMQSAFKPKNQNQEKDKNLSAEENEEGKEGEGNKIDAESSGESGANGANLPKPPAGG